jgi:hypothetical protein
MEAVALVGLAILIGLLLVLPVLGAQLGIDLSVVSRVLEVSTGTAHRAGAAMARNDSRDSTGAFCPLRATPPPGSTANDSYGHF